MSHAFLKNDDGEAWVPPTPQASYAAHAVYGTLEASEALRSGDDLAPLLRWASQTARGEVRVRDRAGTLLAVIGADD